MVRWIGACAAERLSRVGPGHRQVDGRSRRQPLRGAHERVGLVELSVPSA